MKYDYDKGEWSECPAAVYVSQSIFPSTEFWWVLSSNYRYCLSTSVKKFTLEEVFCVEKGSGQGGWSASDFEFCGKLSIVVSIKDNAVCAKLLQLLVKRVN